MSGRRGVFEVRGKERRLGFEGGNRQQAEERGNWRVRNHVTEGQRDGAVAT